MTCTLKDRKFSSDFEFAYIMTRGGSAEGTSQIGTLSQIGTSQIGTLSEVLEGQIRVKLGNLTGIYIN